METRNVMLGLKQARRIANERHTKHLQKYGHAPCPHTPTLWRHNTLPIVFTLVVNDFGVKYTGKHNVDHLINALCELYTITVDQIGSLYYVLTLAWDYALGHVGISMPNYIKQTLQKFKHPLAPKPEYTPQKWKQSVYGANQNLANAEENRPVLPPSYITHIQTVVGTILYYSIAIDNTMLVVLGNLSSLQTKVTQKTLDALTQLLNYSATHLNATVRFWCSGMILHIHSDRFYLLSPKSRSRSGVSFPSCPILMIPPNVHQTGLSMLLTKSCAMSWALRLKRKLEPHI